MAALISVNTLPLLLKSYSFSIKCEIGINPKLTEISYNGL